MTRFARFALATTIMLMCTLPANAQTAVVTKFGDHIIEDEIAQRTKLNFLSTHRHTGRQDVIYELADDKDKIKEAEKSGFDVTTYNQLDNAIAEMCARMHITPERLTASLEDQGVRLDTLKMRMKADMARSRLTRLRYYRYDDRLLPRR